MSRAPNNTTLRLSLSSLSLRGRNNALRLRERQLNPLPLHPLQHSNRLRDALLKCREPILAQPLQQLHRPLRHDRPLIRGRLIHPIQELAIRNQLAENSQHPIMRELLAESHKTLVLDIRLRERR